jgi:hypothetical protein
MGETFRRIATTLSCCTLATSLAFAQSETVVLVASAPVRIMPDASRAPLATLKPGVTVRLEEHEGNWYRVSFRDLRWGWRVGYVQAEHVDAARTHAEVAVVPQRADIAGPATEQEVPAAEDPEPDVTSSGPTPAPTAPSAASPVYAAERPAAESRYGGLSKRAISESIAIGRRQYRRTQGLQLSDSARQFPAEFGGADANGTTLSAGLKVQVFTPLAWIRQLAGEAKTENKQIRVDDLSVESTEPVLRVIAYLNVRKSAATAGTPRSSVIQQIVLRNPDTGTVVQPTTVKLFRSDAANAAQGRSAFEGLLVKFPMDAVRGLRGGDEDREFLITVTSSTRETRDFRVRRDDFNKLPGGR